MTLEQFRKMTAHLPGSVQIVVPGPDHSYRFGRGAIVKTVRTGRHGQDVSPFFGEDPELYGLASSVIVAARTLQAIEVA